MERLKKNTSYFERMETNSFLVEGNNYTEHQFDSLREKVDVKGSIR